MDYAEARKYIDSLKGRGICPGLDNIRVLCEELGNPQRKVRVAHIAGTNGKGSVGAFLSSILRAAGKRTARFATPAVEDYSELFMLDDNPADNERYVRAVEEVRAAAERLESREIFVTSFEAETAAAFVMFEEFTPDCAIIECGMGGALDSTNVVENVEVSIITSISSDHTAYLGDTIEKIAEQKCGIIKEGVPAVVCGQPSEAENVIKAAAAAKHSRLYVADGIKNVKYRQGYTEFEFENSTYTIPLMGSYQPQNAAIAVKAAEILGVNKADIARGLKSTVWHYRFERVGKYILDGAHNPAAAWELARSVEIYLNGKKTAFVTGCFKDKDYGKVAKIMAPYAAKVYTVTAPGERGLDAETLAAEYSAAGADAQSVGSTEEGVGLSEFGYDAIVVFGTLSILADAKRCITSAKNAVEMERLNRVYTHPLYRQRMRIIAENERERKFCRHDLSHALDVARIGYIVILERGLKIDKELFYTAALLHDAGRYGGMPHNESGAELAEKIMPECGFSDEETEVVRGSIRAHRSGGDGTDFADLLYFADKRSRMCSDCAAADECYWDTDKRNHRIEV